MKWLVKVAGCFGLLVLTAFAPELLPVLWRNLVSGDTSTIGFIVIPAVCLIS